METWTGTRANPFNGSPGVAPSPEGSEVAALILADDAYVAGRKWRNFKVCVQQKSENSPTSKSRITVEDIEAYNMERFWNGVQGQETYDAILRRVQAIGIERNFVSWRSVYGGLIEDTFADGGDNIGMPFQIGYFFEQCADITLRRARGVNFYGRDASSSGYSNGDIFATEGNARNMVFDTCGGVNLNGDAVFDGKGNPTFLGVNDATGARRNYRLWEGVKAALATLISISPKGQDFWTKGDSGAGVPVCQIERVEVSGAAPDSNAVFRCEDGAADWVIRSYDIRDRVGKVLHQNTYGRPIIFQEGGWYTGADGSRTFYPGAPPTGAGGVLL